MKKVVSLILALVMCLSLCACGGGNTNNTESIKSKVESCVDARVQVGLWMYDTTGLPRITHTIRETGSNKFEVSGKVTVSDKYGDSYSGKYDATVTYDAAKDACKVTSFDLDKLYKVK